MGIWLTILVRLENARVRLMERKNFKQNKRKTEEKKKRLLDTAVMAFCLSAVFIGDVRET